MTTTTSSTLGGVQSPPAAGVPVRPVALSERAVRRRRRPGMVWLGIASSAACALAAVALVARAGDRVEVLAVARPVPYGQVIGAGDLTVARIAADPALKPVAAAERDRVVGKVAAFDLRPGALLTLDAVSGEVIPGPDQQVVPVALRPGQLPAGGLAPRTPVEFVPTSGQDGDVSGGGRLPPPIAATVLRVGRPGEDGTSVLDAVVDSADGPTLAAWAAGGHVALVVDPGRR